jgi:hypothetical protein
MMISLELAHESLEKRPKAKKRIPIAIGGEISDLPAGCFSFPLTSCALTPGIECYTKKKEAAEGGGLGCLSKWGKLKATIQSNIE